jgi:hypothetical protein
MSGEESWINRLLRRLADPYFWGAFIPIIIVKLVLFQFAAGQYLATGVHPLFGWDFAVVEGYSDFTYYYMNFVRRFVQGYLPYTENLYTISGLQTYIYPPLFVYILSAFYFVPSETLFPNLIIESLILGRSLDFLRVGFAFIVFDFATCVVLFTTARQLSSNRFVPVVAMLVFALNPISLWWGNYLWLSTPIHTFFLALGFFYLVRKEMLWAVAWITVATMVKQTAGLLLPLVLILEFRHSMERLFKALAVTVAIVLLVSLPYIALFPFTYFGALTAGMGSYWFYNALPPVTHPVPISVLAIGWPEPFKFIAITLVFNAIPWITFLALFWLSGIYIAEQSGRDYTDQVLLVALLLSLASHIFFARGLYKFYLIALLPFLVLFGTALNRPVFSRTGDSMGTRGWQRLRMQLCRVGNNWATLWFVFVIAVSVGIFFVYRYFEHLILLGIFVPLFAFAVYRYVWKPYRHRKLAQASKQPNEESAAKD